MLFQKMFFLLFTPAFFCFTAAQGQQVKHYNLVKMLHENKLETTTADQEIQVFFNPRNQAISVNGILWVKDVNFKEGAIDVDMRGKNIFLQSFLGIAFHAMDSKHYDLVYFCPFRFHDSDIVTRNYSIKYMSLPDYNYLTLRKDYPGVYENAASPAPQSDEWFHVTIVVKEGWITVYINHSAIPSLKIQQLHTLTEGKIGLWSYSKTLSSDFANLTITK